MYEQRECPLTAECECVNLVSVGVSYIEMPMVCMASNEREAHGRTEWVHHALAKSLTYIYIDICICITTHI